MIFIFLPFSLLKTSLYIDPSCVGGVGCVQIWYNEGECVEPGGGVG